MSQQNPQENMVIVLSGELEALKEQYQMVREQNDIIAENNHTLYGLNERLGHDNEQLKLQSVVQFNDHALVAQERDRLDMENQNLRADLEREKSQLICQLNAEKAMVELRSKDKAEVEAKMNAKVDQLENEIVSLKQRLMAKENLIKRIENVCKAPTVPQLSSETIKIEPPPTTYSHQPLTDIVRIQLGFGPSSTNSGLAVKIEPFPTDDE